MARHMAFPRFLACVLAIFALGPMARGEVANIDAMLMTGYYINFKNTAPIQLAPDAAAADPFHTFKGCTESMVESNFNARLLASARATSPAGGRWEVDLNTPVIPVGQTRVRLCIVGRDVRIETLEGGQSAVKVAEIRVEVIAQ